MQRRIAIWTLTTTALLVPFLGTAQETADFSGTWKMDPTRSESAHQDVPIGPVTMIIKQTPDVLIIETQRNDSKKTGPTSETMTFKLDGKENVSTGLNSAPVKTTAHWEGSAIVLESERNVQGSTITVKNIHSLGANGSEMTVERKLTVQHGYQFEGAKISGSGKDVFLKVKAPAPRQ